ncbi:MAG: NADP-dependent isocitrate dehydrogenase, partial [Flavobacteriaceae bacterium]|nr:NADP-dependent isocitrate dehydrogenase [Flavobacteriaceae bacterium]
DNRGSHFYLAMYWAEELAKQHNASLKEKFSIVAKSLKDKEAEIVKDLIEVQGNPVDMGGYYMPNEELTNNAMRPSSIFNDIITSI